MAKVCFVLCFAILVLATSTDGRKARPNFAEEFAIRNKTNVCNPTRFRDLGLNMNDFPYCDSTLPIDIRIKDLIDRMTVEEKVLQLGNHAEGVDRLGLPPYGWWAEALHGISNVAGGARFDATVPGATSFPTPIVMAAAFNEKLWKSIGQAVSTEARGMNNVGHTGMTFWSPNINVVRDPRWGRTLETSGEDPFVVGRYATNYVRGLQDIEGKEHTKDPRTRPLKVAACCKHYVAYDVDHWQGVSRYTFNAQVQERDMIETFQKPFEMCVKDGDVASVMCSYNKVNGLPTCADAQLLKDTIRGKWGLNGYIVSDCDSVEVMHDAQHFLGYTPVEDVAIVLRAGLDLDCGNFYHDHLASAVVNFGKVRVPDIDNALTNLYVVLTRLGFFDGRPEFENLGPADVCNEEHINLAIQAAREGMVLLKNDNQTLPLTIDEIRNLAVIGPHSNATDVMIGNYAGVPCRYTSPLDAFKQNIDVIHEFGCDVACQTVTGIPAAVEAAKQADATVLMVGLDLQIEREDLDRFDLLLPGFQTQLINQVAAAAKGPVILVVMSAGCIDIGFAKSNPKITSIIWAGYPGEEGGHGIADVVFGKFNPSGRLPLTWYDNSYISILPMNSMPLRSVNGYPGRTYKFFDGPVVYPFGYGLSYTNFSYKVISSSVIDIQLNKYTKCRDLNYAYNVEKPACPSVLIDDLSHYNKRDLKFDFSIEVKNTGNVFGSDAVLVFWVPPKGILDAPIKQLIAFQKVFLGPGNEKKLHFKFTLKDLGLVDYQSYNLLAAGVHTIVIGDISFPLIVNLQN